MRPQRLLVAPRLSPGRRAPTAGWPEVRNAWNRFRIRRLTRRADINSVEPATAQEGTRDVRSALVERVER
jgi:hypothetical protein